MNDTELNLVKFLILVMAIIAFSLAIFVATSISRGSTIRALCLDLAINEIYTGECESWTYTRDLHRNLRQQADIDTQ